MTTSFMCVSQKLAFHQSKCISATKHILSTTAMYVSSSSFMYLCIPCYCDACLKSNALRMRVKTLHNTIKYDSIQWKSFQQKGMHGNLRGWSQYHKSTSKHRTYDHMTFEFLVMTPDGIPSRHS